MVDVQYVGAFGYPLFPALADTRIIGAIDADHVAELPLWRLVAWDRDDILAAPQIAKPGRHRTFIQHRVRFAKLRKQPSHGDRRADGVPVGLHVRHDQEIVSFTNKSGGFLQYVSPHALFPLTTSPATLR